jgi:hypothetical protein
MAGNRRDAALTGGAFLAVLTRSRCKILVERFGSDRRGFARALELAADELERS